MGPASRRKRCGRAGGGRAPPGPMERLRKLCRGRTMTFGVPLLVDPTLKEKLKQNTVTLESEYEKLEKSDLDNWENIRGPRLWEDSRAVQKQRREAARLKTE